MAQKTQSLLDELFALIEERKAADPENSYVAGLYQKGRADIAQKVGEEAVEVVIEAMRSRAEDTVHDIDSRERLAAESADLLFHLMVLWSDAGLSPGDITDILQQRLGKSGLTRNK